MHDFTLYYQYMTVSASQHNLRSKSWEKGEEIKCTPFMQTEEERKKMVKCERLLLTNQIHPSGGHRIILFQLLITVSFVAGYLLFLAPLLPCYLYLLLYFQFHNTDCWIIRKFYHNAINTFKGHIRTGNYCHRVAFVALLSLIQKLR